MHRPQTNTMDLRKSLLAFAVVVPLLHCVPDPTQSVRSVQTLTEVSRPVQAAPGHTRIKLHSKSGATGDWCSRVAVRPDRRFTSIQSCTRTWTPAELSRDIDFVLLGEFNDVLASEAISKVPKCGGMFSHENNRLFIREINQSVPDTGRRPKTVHMTRLELVSPPHIQAKGFKSDFLLRTTTPLENVEKFFSRDRSKICRGRCRFVFRRKIGNEQTEIGLDRAIDERGRPNQHANSVYYISMRNREQISFSPHAVVADLRNPEYRAWRIKRLKASLEAGGYDAIMLNHKFGQYWTRQGYWLGSAACPDISRCTNGIGNIFSAPPDGYGYAEYVEGWVAFARDLDAAGIPYVVRLAPNPWLTKADSRSTPDIDERQSIRSVLLRADTVLLSASNVGYLGSIDRWHEQLRREGANIVPINETCGYSKTSVN